MMEQRQHPRRRTLKAGQIIFNHRSSVISCTVRNLSDGGACLELGSSVGIPESFDLIVDADGLSRSCDVAWRSEHRIGVAFR
jgi:hypothetical protein